jgi:hypothetical protein
LKYSCPVFHTESALFFVSEMSASVIRLYPA